VENVVSLVDSCVQLPVRVIEREGCAFVQLVLTLFMHTVAHISCTAFASSLTATARRTGCWTRRPSTCSW
jgi:hypothetical protein